MELDAIRLKNRNWPLHTFDFDEDEIVHDEIHAILTKQVSLVVGGY